MSDPLLVGLDVGTTGVKTVLVDAQLHTLASASRRIPTQHPHPGWVEQKGEDILAAGIDAVAEVLGGAPGEVVGCGLDHQGESVIAWDAETGEPLSPNVVWQDKRATSVLDRLTAAGHDEEITRRSGLPISMIRPTLAVTSGGVEYVISTIGAIRKCPSAIGKTSSRSRTIVSIRRMTSVGKRMLSAVPERSPSRSRSRSMPRLSPSSPPAPPRKNP